MARKSRSTVQLIGFIANEPVLRYTQEGTAVINIVVIENETWKEGEETKERSHRHQAVFWGKYAETVAKIAEKGTYCLIEGSLRYRPIEGEQYKQEAEVKGENYILLDGPRDRDGAGAN